MRKEMEYKGQATWSNWRLQTLHPTAAEYAFPSSVCGMFTTQTIFLAKKVSPNKFRSLSWNFSTVTSQMKFST